MLAFAVVLLVVAMVVAAIVGVIWRTGTTGAG